jgi:thioredoxin-like negative regulator of GroEL
MMPVISGIVLALLLSRDEGIKAFNEGRYSVALSKLTDAAKDPNDKEARLFLALAQAATGDCASALPKLSPLVRRMSRWPGLPQ